MNRITVVAVAAIVALVSGFGLVSYVGGAEDRAAATVQSVNVYVAASDVAAGTSFEDALADHQLVPAPMLRDALPPTAVTDPTALRGMVADGLLRAGQTVVSGTFALPEDLGRQVGPATFAADLPQGTVAVSFDAAGSSAVSDLVSPGDHVNLLVNVPNAAELGLPDSHGPAVVHVFQDLEVMAIGQAIRPDVNADEAVANPGASTYTVAVAPRDAARLLLLTREYEVFLTLVGPGTKAAEQRPVGKSDALPSTLTPKVPGKGEQ